MLESRIPGTLDSFFSRQFSQWSATCEFLTLCGERHPGKDAHTRSEGDPCQTKGPESHSEPRSPVTSRQDYVAVFGSRLFSRTSANKRTTTSTKEIKHFPAEILGE